MAIKTFTTGEVLTASDTNTYLNNGGLVLLTSGITVSSVGGTAATVNNGTVSIGNGNTSVTVSNAFSAAYDNYRIFVTNGAASTTAQVRLQLSGITTAVYYGGFAGTNFTTSAFYGQNDNAGNHFTWVGYASTAGFELDADLHSPFIAARKYLNARNVYVFAGNAYGNYVGECASTTSSTGFILSPNTGSFSSGTISVYGYRKA